MTGRNFEYFGEDPFLASDHRGVHPGRAEGRRFRHRKALSRQ
jgi:hypothetical protein